MKLIRFAIALPLLIAALPLYFSGAILLDIVMWVTGTKMRIRVVRDRIK